MSPEPKDSQNVPAVTPIFATPNPGDAVMLINVPAVLAQKDINDTLQILSSEATDNKEGSRDGQ